MVEDKSDDIAPPFHGFIATTYDALLVFEAARRGMIPRVTRRLNDSERNMVQSGSVFVYDEQESGIKRWTDGHSWSPSRILANFLVYRETIKPAEGKDAKDGEMVGIKKETPSTPGSRPGSAHRRDGRPTTSSGSPITGSPAVGGDAGNISNYGESSRMAMEATSRPLAHGQMRPRSAAEAGGCRLENGIIIDRHLERKLVGSLTNSYLFQPGGLVKKTMTLTISGYHQHVVSYYTLEDAVAGRLRRPSTIPEFAALDISPEYLNVANFRYPPSIELVEGVPRYHGEPDDRPISPARVMPQYGAEVYEAYPPHPAPMDMHHHQPRVRSVPIPTVPTFAPAGSAAAYMQPMPSQGYYEPQPTHMTPVPRQTGAMRPSSSSSRRYDPYTSNRPGTAHAITATSVPETSMHVRRLSQPPSSSGADGGYYQASEYNYQPPSTAPSSFGYYQPQAPAPPAPPSLASPVVSSPSYGAPQYQSWQPSGTMRIMSAPGRGDMTGLDPGHPPSSSGSMDSAPGSSHHVMPPESWAPMPPAGAQPVWDTHAHAHAHAHPPAPPPVSQYAMPGDGWQAGIA